LPSFAFYTTSYAPAGDACLSDCFGEHCEQGCANDDKYGGGDEEAGAFTCHVDTEQRHDDGVSETQPRGERDRAAKPTVGEACHGEENARKLQYLQELKSVGRLGLMGCDDAVRLPRSLHYATRRTQIARKKRPGRAGRDDR
jgi:hypothetical protein